MALTTEQCDLLKKCGIDASTAASFDWAALLRFIQAILAAMAPFIPPVPVQSNSNCCDHKACCCTCLTHQLKALECCLQHLCECE